MSRIRGGVSKAHFNEQNVALLSVEIVGLSVVAGWYALSWYALAGTFALLVAWVMSPLVYGLVFVFAGAWGAGGWFLGNYIGGTPAGVVFAMFWFCVAFAAHHSGAQYIRDVADEAQQDL